MENTFQRELKIKYWFQYTDELESLSEEDKDILGSQALSSITKFILVNGFTSGELCESINGVDFYGWWQYKQNTPCSKMSPHNHKYPLTVIFGTQPVEYYQKTGERPKDKYQFSLDGDVRVIEFDTEDELNTYKQAIFDCDGWHRVAYFTD